MRFIRGLVGFGSVLALAAGCNAPQPQSPSPGTPSVSATPAPAQSPFERGKYLTMVGGCNDCHTPKKLGPNGPEADMSRELNGNPASDKVASLPMRGKEIF